MRIMTIFVMGRIVGLRIIGSGCFWRLRRRLVGMHASSRKTRRSTTSYKKEMLTDAYKTPSPITWCMRRGGAATGTAGREKRCACGTTTI